MEGLEEWEVLPGDGFLEIHDDGGKKFFSTKYSIAPENVFKNYFSPKFAETTATESERARVPNQLVPVPIQLEPDVQRLQDNRVFKEAPAPIEINLRPSIAVTGEAADQDPVSQVFFKKMKETVVDMKLDSPKSNNKMEITGIKPQVDAAAFQFDEKAEAAACKATTAETLETTTKIPSPRLKADRDEDKMMIEENGDGDMDSADHHIKKEADNWEENSGGMNILKWSLTGIGAICSFGVATVCIFVFGGLGKNKHHHQDNQKLHFDIFNEDKRMKQMAQQATKLNEAISAVRGVPISRAHITVGGYYDCL